MKTTNKFSTWAYLKEVLTDKETRNFFLNYEPPFGVKMKYQIWTFVFSIASIVISIIAIALKLKG